MSQRIIGTQIIISIKVKRKRGIISAASHKWKDIAVLIYDDANKQLSWKNSIRMKQMSASNKYCLIPQNWNGLIELLNDVELAIEALANKIKLALSSYS